MHLKDLRELVGTQQVAVAAAMQVNQAAVSRFENRGNIQIEPLSAYIEAMGGELELRAARSESVVSHLSSMPALTVLVGVPAQETLGSRKMKVAPVPGWASVQILPLWASMMPLAMNRPRPDPSWSRRRACQ